MNNTPAQPAKLKGVFILRDKDGNPKFDDPMNVPMEILEALSVNDLNYLAKLQYEQSRKELN